MLCEAEERDEARRAAAEKEKADIKAKPAVPASPAPTYSAPSEPFPAEAPQSVRSSKPQREEDPEAKARHDAYAAKAEVDARAELAHTLHKAGLVGRAELKRVNREREQAQAKVDKHRTLQEKLGSELKKELTPDTHKPKGRTLPPSPGRDDTEPER